VLFYGVLFGYNCVFPLIHKCSVAAAVCQLVLLMGHCAWLDVTPICSSFQFTGLGLLYG